MKKNLFIFFTVILIISLCSCNSSDSGGKLDINIVDGPSDNGTKNNPDDDHLEGNPTEADPNEDEPIEGAPTEDDTVKKYFSVHPETGFFNMDTDLFDVSYMVFQSRLSHLELTEPEEWPWFGHDMEVVYVNDGKETYTCLFQNNKLVLAYWDATDDDPGRMYSTAVSYFGEPVSTSEYYSGSKDYMWKLTTCYYQQHVERYGNGERHYRQQYVSLNYDDSQEEEVVYYMYVEDENGFFYFDSDLFGLTYSELKSKISYCEFTDIEEWPYFGPDMEVTYANDGDETYSCLFQYGKLVMVYRDAADDNPGGIYTAAVQHLGNPSYETDYWSGSLEYTWDFGSYNYQQHVEIYDGNGHYRQIYVSYDYIQ